MSALAAVFRLLARVGFLAVTAPVLLVWAAFYLFVATTIAFFLLVLLRQFVLDLPIIGPPSTLLDWIANVVIYGSAWAAALVVWAEHTGIALWFRHGPGDSHGSARFASEKELGRLEAGDGLLIGRNPVTGRLLRYDGPARQRFGTVHVLDPFEVTGLPAAAYNPLDRLTPDSRDLGEDATSLADALVMDPPDQVSEAHWNEEAKALLAGLILFCVAHEDPDRRCLATVREYLTLPPDRLRALLELMQESDAAGGLIARAANRFLGKADREAASVLSNAQRHTHFLDSPRIARVTSRSDFQFAELRHQITSVFLVLPPNRLDAYARWLRLLVSQALQDIARDAERLGIAPAPPEASTGPQGALGAPETATAAQGPSEGHQEALQAPALFLLDEFAALGRLEAVERAMGLMAGYGLQLWPILQDMSQLQALYGKRAGTFVANAGVQQVFGVNDFETAKWLSQTIGQETTAYRTQSFKPGDPAATSLNVTGRDLMTPDEIMQLPAELQLLRVQGTPTAIARKLRYYADPEFQGLFVAQDA